MTSATVTKMSSKWPRRKEQDAAQVARVAARAERIKKDVTELRKQLVQQARTNVHNGRDGESVSADAAPVESDIVSASQNPRPKDLSEVVGQETLKLQIQTVLLGAQLRGDRIPNVLLQGASGCGKTSIARVISETVGYDLITTSGPMLRRPQDLTGLVLKITEPTILFVDEIHSANRTCLEGIYSILEDGRIDLLGASGDSAVAHTHMASHITVVAATTQAGALAEPLRNRFQTTFTLADYSEDELAQIVARLWDRKEIPYAEGEPEEVAKRCKSTPRRCVHLATRVLDLLAIDGSPAVHPGTVAHAMNIFGIRQTGLDDMDLKYLHALTDTFNGRAGLEALGSFLNTDARSLSEQVEPYLARQGVIIRTRGGRLATQKAWEIIKEESLG